jgi:ribose-phosphate pyrophosphokinase
MSTLIEPKLITGNSNIQLAKNIATRMSLHRGQPVGLIDTRVERFNDGEIFVEVFSNLVGWIIKIYQMIMLSKMR